MKATKNKINKITMENTLKFEMKAQGAENLVLAYDGTNDYSRYLAKLESVVNAMNNFKRLHDEELKDLNLSFDLMAFKSGIIGIQSRVSTAIGKLPKFSQLEANHYYANVMQELTRAFYNIPFQSMLIDAPEGLQYLIEQVEFNEGNFVTKSIEAKLFDKYIGGNLYNNLVAYVTAYNALEAQLAAQIDLLDQLIIGNEGLQYNRKMDVAKIGFLSKFL